MNNKKSYIVYSEEFNINDMDKDGKKFDRVSRFTGRSESGDVELILDVNIDLYALDIGDKIELLLSTGLAMNSEKIEESMVIEREDNSQKASWREKVSNEPDLSDNYEYVMYGKVYKYVEYQAGRIGVFVSFGGLLMSIEGNLYHLHKLNVGQNVYLLVRRINES
ncbi:13097_t:CDS:2 [Entrophospora sp. SA101]|nr:14567_t:CDS:2 [Entrophospora candida]CAH1759218.1 13097_t:CDS:2 [Entrophospora sp. SA101]